MKMYAPAAGDGRSDGNQRKGVVGPSGLRGRGGQCYSARLLTAVIEANVVHRSDRLLLRKGVAKTAAGAKKLKTMGSASAERAGRQRRACTVRSGPVDQIREPATLYDEAVEVKRINGDLAAISRSEAAW